MRSRHETDCFATSGTVLSGPVPRPEGVVGNRDAIVLCNPQSRECEAPSRSYLVCAWIYASVCMHACMCACVYV